MGESRAEGANGAMATLSAEYWSRFLDDEPIVSTDVGESGRDHLMPDRRPEAIEARIAWYDRVLASLAEVRDEELAEADNRRIAAVIGFHASTRREWFEREGHVRQFANHLEGPAQLLAQVATIQRVDDHATFAAFRDRLRAFPQYLDVAVDRLRQARRLSSIPRVVIERSIGQMERLTSTPASRWPMPTGIRTNESQSDAADSIVDRTLRPAFARFLDALRAARPAASSNHGVGADEYAFLISYFTGSRSTPLEIHELGLGEVERVGQQRAELIRESGQAAAEELVRAYAGRHADRLDRGQLLRWIERLVDLGLQGTAAGFGRLPTTPCLVRVVESWREDDVPAAFYEPPSSDGSRPGVYYVNGARFGTRALHKAPTSSFHEANPGHHFQAAFVREAGSSVPLLRHAEYLSGDAFLEGWGLYAETLADDFHLHSEAAERLGYLDNEMLRACRLVVDTGVHALGWDRTRAIDYLVAHGESREWAAVEVDRYAAIPGQALAYKLGQHAILRWREEALVQGASLREFHDALLAIGTLPLDVIERELPWTGRR